MREHTSGLPELSPSIRHPFELHDVTLREGDQHVGVAFSVEEKLTIAGRLVDAGITSIQAGFPSLSPLERDAVLALTQSGLPADFHCLCRYEREDLDLAAACGIRRIGFSVHGSKAMTAESRERLHSFVKHGKDKGLFMRMSCEDVARSDRSNVFAWYDAAEAAGADMITLADTVGRCTPAVAHRLVAEMKERFSLPIAVHFHNDLGLATANTLVALDAGASQLQVSVGGLGERAGIASLEEVAVILVVNYGCNRLVDATKLCALHALVWRCAGVDAADTKPIVGTDVFTHECGLHVEELIANPERYNPFDPRLLGRACEFRVGKHTTDAALAHLLCDRGADVSVDAQKTLLALVQALAVNKVLLSEDVLVEVATVLQQATLRACDERIQ